MGIYDREEALIGEEGLKILKDAAVAVFGIGGVGSYTAEALVRAGVGRLVFIDGDVVEKTNINRQLIALHSTLGMPKAEVMAKRAEDIDPECIAEAKVLFYSADTAAEIPFDGLDYIVDAVDDVEAKVLLAVRAEEHGIPIISSMGTGNKLYADFEIADIYKTTVCPLARVMRRRLKDAGVRKLKVLYSKTEPYVRSKTPASISTVPSRAGLLIASEVITDILRKNGFEI